MTKDYSAQIKTFLDERGRLKAFPAKRKKKVYALAYLAGKLEKGRVYTEKEICSALEDWSLTGDAATLRREMFNYGFIDRLRDGSAYWLNENPPDVDGMFL